MHLKEQVIGGNMKFLKAINTVTFAMTVIGIAVLIAVIIVVSGCGSKYSYDTLDDICEVATTLCELVPEVDTVYNIVPVVEYYPDTVCISSGVFQPIYFAENSADLPKSIEFDTRALIKYLYGCPDSKVTLKGHCDERRNAQYNYTLGLQRADMVKQWLIKRGISGNRVGVISDGEHSPLATGHNEHSWKLNRRVEVVVE